MAIKLSPEASKKLQASIKRYVSENLDQDIPEGLTQVLIIVDHENLPCRHGSARR